MVVAEILEIIVDDFDFWEQRNIEEMLPNFLKNLKGIKLKLNLN